MAAGNSKMVVVAALFANAGIAIVKGIAAYFTGSGAMLAETVHSVADSGNQALLLLGAHRAKRPPDERHPFGYGAERYFWAFVVAVLLFAMGALFSLYEGVHKLLHPVAIRRAEWAYVVLFISLALEGGSYFVAAREVRKARGSRGFWAYVFGSKDPALSLVYLEDVGALLGLVFALTGVFCSHVLGWIRADAIATLAVGFLLLGVAGVLLVRCHRLLIGESASPADKERILAAARGVERVEDVVDLKTLHVGPETLIVFLDVRFDGGAETVIAIEHAIQAAVPAARHVAVELR